MSDKAKGTVAAWAHLVPTLFVVGGAVVLLGGSMAWLGFVAMAAALLMVAVGWKVLTRNEK